MAHVYADGDGVNIWLNDSLYPADQYDIEITRSFADQANNNSSTAYGGGMFTYRTLSGTVQRIPNQGTLVSACSIENYASFRDEYPIRQKNLALICIRARNLQVSSLSALFSSQVSIWNGTDWSTVAASNNPAALARDVMIGRLNARRIPEGRLEDLSGWFDKNVAKGLACNYVSTQGSVEQVATLIAACGDAALRRSDKWGVVIDEDRSAEAPSGMFHPGNMTSALTVKKVFVTGARCIVPHILDEDNTFAETDLEPVFDDGLVSSSDTLTEVATYDGLTSAALGRRRAKLDLRRQRLRTLLYTWVCICRTCA